MGKLRASGARAPQTLVQVIFARVRPAGPGAGAAFAARQTSQGSRDLEKQVRYRYERPVVGKLTYRVEGNRAASARVITARVGDEEAQHKAHAPQRREPVTEL